MQNAIIPNMFVEYWVEGKVVIEFDYAAFINQSFFKYVPSCLPSISK